VTLSTSKRWRTVRKGEDAVWVGGGGSVGKLVAGRLKLDVEAS
jgi:hypothetical protein